MMHIQLIRNDAVATVRLNRPEALNALSEDMKEELTAVFSELALDGSIRAVVLGAVGKAFCVSGDVKTLLQPDLGSSRARLARAQRMIVSIYSIDKPVIAAARGAVAGIGWSMLMACDHVLASESTFFSQVFKNVGLVPDGGAVYFLAQHVGMLRAKELVLSGRRLPVTEALAMGLVNRIVPDESLENEAQTLAQQLAGGPTQAFGLGKRLFRRTSGTTLESFLESETEAQVAAFQTEDHQEGVQAFLDKRTPQFKGA